MKLFWSTVGAVCVGVYLWIGLHQMFASWGFLELPANSDQLLLVQVCCYAAFLFLHHTEIEGIWSAMLLAVVSVSVTLAAEIEGVSNGVLFGGEYRFSEFLMQSGPVIAGKVPVMVIVSWYALTYPSHVIIQTILTGTNRGLRPESLLSKLWVSVLCALIMSGVDIATDPLYSTYGRTHPGIPLWWTWKHPLAPIASMSPTATPTATATTATTAITITATTMTATDFFGVPIQNFHAWLLSSFCIFFLFRLLSSLLPCHQAKQQQQQQQQHHHPLFVGLPAFTFSATAIYLSTNLFHPPALRLIAMFVMAPPAMLAVHKLLQERSNHSNGTTL